MVKMRLWVHLESIAWQSRELSDMGLSDVGRSAPKAAAAMGYARLRASGPR